MNNQACPQTAAIGSSENMIQTLRDTICKAPIIQAQN